MSEERRCQLKALLDEEWGKVESARPKLTVVPKQGFEESATARCRNRGVTLTTDEAEFSFCYRRCSAADQSLLFRALAGDDEAMRTLGVRR